MRARSMQQAGGSPPRSMRWRRLPTGGAKPVMGGASSPRRARRSAPIPRSSPPTSIPKPRAPPRSRPPTRTGRARADELVEAGKRLRRLEEDLAALQDARVVAAERSQATQAAIAAALDSAAERIERVIKGLNRGLGEGVAIG